MPGVSSPWGAGAEGLDNVLTVAASNSVAGSSTGGTLARFSNFGNGVKVVAPGGVRIENPSVGVWSTWVRRCFLVLQCSDYAPQWGTSMAAPMVAGVAALVRQRFPTMAASQVGRCIIGTSGFQTAVLNARSDRPMWDKGSPQMFFPEAQLSVVNAEAAVRCEVDQFSIGGARDLDRNALRTGFSQDPVDGQNAQTFTAGKTGRLRRVVLRMDSCWAQFSFCEDRPNDGRIRVTLTGVNSDGTPNDQAVIDRVEVPGTVIPQRVTGFAASDIGFEFPNRPRITAGTRYALVIQVLGHHFSGYQIWLTDRDVMSGGAFYDRSNNGTWLRPQLWPDPDFIEDAYFAVYVS
jgi:hypothetical protein